MHTLFWKNNVRFGTTPDDWFNLRLWDNLPLLWEQRVRNDANRRLPVVLQMSLMPWHHQTKARRLLCLLLLWDSELPLKTNHIIFMKSWIYSTNYFFLFFTFSSLRLLNSITVKIAPKIVRALQNNPVKNIKDASIVIPFSWWL